MNENKTVEMRQMVIMTELLKLVLEKGYFTFNSHDLKQLMPDTNKRNCQIRRSVQKGDFRRTGRGEYSLNPIFIGMEPELSPKALEDTLRNIVRTLQDAGAKEIYFFGSYLSGMANPMSDIDIGVKGLPPSKYFSAWNAIDRLSKKRIDLVDFDESSQFFEFLTTNKKIKLIGEENGCHI